MRPQREENQGVWVPRYHTRWAAWPGRSRHTTHRNCQREWLAGSKLRLTVSARDVEGRSLRRKLGGLASGEQETGARDGPCMGWKVGRWGLSGRLAAALRCRATLSGPHHTWLCQSRLHRLLNTFAHDLPFRIQSPMDRLEACSPGGHPSSTRTALHATGC